MKRVGTISLMFLLTFTLLFPKEQLKVGVIYENESYVEYMGEVLKDELKRNFEGSDYEVEVQRATLVGTKSEFDSELASMEADKEIDAIVTMGVTVSELTLLEAEGYDKLVVAPFGVGQPEHERKNLSYITEVTDIPGDIKFMEELKEIKRVSFVVPEFYDEGYLKTQTDKILKQVEDAGYQVDTILVGDDLEKIGQQLDNTDAIYVFELTYKNVDEILDLAREKKVISFSRVSGKGGSQKVLMGYDNTPEVQRRVRAAVVSMRRRMEGDDPAEIVTDLGKSDKSIDFNMALAREIGVFPSLVFAQKVNFINLRERGGKALGFKEGINMALNENTDLKSRRENITTDEYNVKSAKADRRPNIDAFAEYQRLDKDSANSFATPAESSVRGGVSLNYLIFDDNVNANVTIRDYQRIATEERYRQEGLDTVQSFSQAYLTILELNARLEVERYNYELMKEYLQIARTKFEVGAAGPEDIYRFQSEIADALTNIAEVEGQIRIAEADLNRVLNQPMALRYTLEEVNTESNAFREITKILRESGQRVDGIRQFFIEEGIANAPELKQIEAQVSAKERELKAAERERYMPKLSAFGEWSDDLKDDWGEGSDFTQEEDRWNIGARVELPLYKGGDIEYTKQRVRSELRSLEYQKTSLETEVGKQVSSAFAQVVKDYIKTATTKDAADAASKNLELVGDFYAKGTISISDLLDARTNSISADQVEIAARYSYLQSLINLERSTGEYLVMMDDLTKGAKLERLNSYLKSESGR